MIRPAISLMKATEIIADFIAGVFGYIVNKAGLHDCLASCLTVYPGMHIGVYCGDHATHCRLVPQDLIIDQQKYRYQLMEQRDFKRASVNIMPFCRT